MGDQLNLKEKLKDPEHNNWLKAVYIFRELKNGISPFIEDRCREAQEAIHQEVLNKLHVTKVPVCTECTRATLNNKNPPCPEKVCPFIRTEINKLHKNNNFDLHRTDVSAWTNPSRYWEIAKTFMEKGKIKTTSPADTDCTGLLSIIINCMPIHKYLTTDMVATPTVFHELKDLRNKVMHSSDTRLSDELLQDLIQACVQILEDSNTLANDQTAIAARERIKEIEGMLLTVSNVDYPSVFLEVEENLRQEMSEMKTTVTVLGSNMSEQEQKVIALAGKQTSQAKDISNIAGKQTSQAKDISNIAGKQTSQENDISDIARKPTSQAKDISDIAGKQTSQAKDISDIAGKQTSQENDISDIAGKQTSQAKDISDIAGKQTSQAKDMSDIAGKQTSQAKDISDIAGKQTPQEKDMSNIAGKQTSQAKDISDIAWKQKSQDKVISDLTKQQTLQGRVGVLERYIEQLQTTQTDSMDKLDRKSSLSSSMQHETDSSEVKNDLQEQIRQKKKNSEKELEELKVEMEEAGNDMEQEAAAGIPDESVHYSFQGQSDELHNLLSQKQKESLLNLGRYETCGLLNLVRERNIEGVNDLLTSDKTISESEIKDALEWSIKQQDRPIVTLILDNICRLIQASEEDEVVDVWPGYRVDSPWKPIFVLLTRTKYFGELYTFMGYPLYKRGYDFVSFEAAKVISSELVLKNLLSVEDMSKVRNAVSSASLHKVHSNITIINGCPCRSLHDGDEIRKEMCVVVHCRVKDIIPFAEQPFPRELSGIPVDVREAYFMLGMMNPPTSSPLGTSPTDYTEGAGSSTASSSGGQDRDVSHNNFMSGCSASSSSAELDLNEDVTMEHTGPGGDAEMLVYREHLASIFSRRFNITLEEGSKSKEFNRSLLIGSGIGPAGLDVRGSIGGFIPLNDGSIGAITCAHLFIQSWVGDPVTQPADGDFPKSKHSTQSVFGELVKMEFKEGSMDSTGVDAALIKITSRLPQSGEFVWARREQITFAGFEPSSPPNFQEGKILKIQDLSGNDRHTALLKVGSETGLTKGVLYLYGTLVRLTDRDLTLPNGNPVTFFNNIEVSSIRNVTNFFDLGDSGSLVFMPLNGSDLHCIGLAVGCTSYHTCIVTPIESVFNELELPLKFINFLEHSSTN